MGLGIPVALLDRSATSPERPVITSLSQLQEAFEWYA
jgi:hypothetical protein